MKYVIYKMIQLDHLKDVSYEGYSYIKTKYRDVLEELDLPGIQSKHSTFAEATNEVINNKQKLKSLTITILPVFFIGYDGSL